MKSLKVALIADELTTTCLSSACNVVYITPLNYWWVLRFYKPDLLLVESAWHGRRNAWKFKIAAYPDHPERNNDKLDKVVSCARNLGIPTVFWNKEDGVHFSRFIGSARLFDHIFTVDENCLKQYRESVDSRVTVNTLMFPVQPSAHFFSGFNFKFNAANFVGSYSHHVHDRRRQWQDMMFGACTGAGMKLTIYDRNSQRKSANYRYPKMAGLEVRDAVPHDLTANIYRDYLVSLNVNTVDDSATMFSRRLVEILACGGIAVTNPSPAVDRYFSDYCYVVNSEEETKGLLERLKHGPSRIDLERAEAGARYVLAEHTWAHRLQEICRVAGI